MGVWLVVLLWKCQSRLVVSPCMWKRLVVRVLLPCFPLVARGDDAPLWCFVAKVHIVATFWWSHLPLGLIVACSLLVCFWSRWWTLTLCVALCLASSPCCSLPICYYLRCCFLFRVRRRPVVCLLPLLSVGCSGWCCFQIAFGAMSHTVATFVAKALVAVWWVALATCGGRSGASSCALLRANMVVVLLKLLVLRVSCGEFFLLAVWFRLLVQLCCILPGFGACGGTMCSCSVADILSCLALPTSDVFLGFVSGRVPVERSDLLTGWSQRRGLLRAQLHGFRLAVSVVLDGLVRDAPEELSTSSCVLYAVVVHPVSCWMSGLALPCGRVMVVTTRKS
ncbi:hypothetical protein Taro_021119 [Colocasia esculenta]|uniref:Uncharacterized protein n=1 Tax=Colocasia esculenta TaxID=4460 RepID=A0A843V442_COLES|nr:hypothetical protein [Colocasia esculenta]